MEYAVCGLNEKSFVKETHAAGVRTQEEEQKERNVKRL